MEGTTPPARRGLDGVVAGQTRLSHVDGLAGQLIIGGYELTELAGRVSFEEAAHLLWRGALPGTEELEELRRDLAALRPVPAQTIRVGGDDTRATGGAGEGQDKGDPHYLPYAISAAASAARF